MGKCFVKRVTYLQMIRATGITMDPRMVFSRSKNRLQKKEPTKMEQMGDQMKQGASNASQFMQSAMGYSQGRRPPRYAAPFINDTSALGLVFRTLSVERAGVNTQDYRVLSCR